MRGFIVLFLQYGKQEEAVTVETRHVEAFLPVYSLSQRVRRYARAYLKLERDGMGPAGRPLVRSALEHAVTAQWIFYVDGGVNRFKKSANLDQARFFRAITGLPEDHPDVVEVFAMVPEGKGMPPWEQIRKQMEDSTDFLASTYRVLSQSVHVTHGAYLDAIEVDEGNNVSLRDAPDDTAGRAVMYTLAASCLLSWWLDAVCRGDHARLLKLQDHGHNLKMPWRLDQRLPAERRREGSG